MYEIEQQTVDAEIKMLESEIAYKENFFSDVNKFIDIVKKHIDVSSLDYLSLRELVDKIIIHEKTKEPGIGSRGRQIMVTKQKVDIYYNFVGVID